MYSIIPFSEDLDLSDFYKRAEEKGYSNNINQYWINDCFNNEKESQTWILFYENKAVGTVAAHTFPELGERAYRIAVRTCVLSDEISTPSLRTRNQIITHQHVTGQILIPTCIEWAGRNNNLYITSNNLEAGSQRLVHKIYFPAMEKTGQVEHCGEMQYRGTVQTIWKLNVNRFYEILNKNKRWI